MTVSSIAIGDRRIHFCAYNPRNFLTVLYCEWLCHAVETVIGDQDPKLIHQWIRERYPSDEMLSDFLDRVDDGMEVLDITFNNPVTPGQEKFELPIIAHLEAEKRAADNRG